MPFDLSVFRGRKVLVTGDTGFKGAWLVRLLHSLGAEVSGIGLPMDTQPSLFEAFGGGEFVAHRQVDIRDAGALAAAIRSIAPDYVVHMAAQALVRRSFREPVETFDTNVIGTLNVLEAVSALPDPPAAVLVVTSDKVYRNDNRGVPFAEDMPLGGVDPYSASKAACELAVASYRNALCPRYALATARAGNVVGGGDWGEDRLIPDFYRALVSNAPIQLRYPYAVRPWQHVLDVLAGYLSYLAAMSAEGADVPLAMNFGPDMATDLPRVHLIVESLGMAMTGRADVWETAPGEHPPEHSLLRLDTRLAGQVLGWSVKLDQAQIIDWTSSWYQAFRAGRDALALVDEQIARYRALP